MVAPVGENSVCAPSFDQLDAVVGEALAGFKVAIEEVGQTALFLASDMSTKVTGEVLHVDSGYHVLGMTADPLDGAEPGEGD